MKAGSQCLSCTPGSFGLVRPDRRPLASVSGVPLSRQRLTADGGRTRAWPVNSQRVPDGPRLERCVGTAGGSVTRMRRDWSDPHGCHRGPRAGVGLSTCRSGPGCDTLAYIWPRSWRKPETLTLPIRPGCAFDPKGDSRQPCVQSEHEALPAPPGDHLLLEEKIATSSRPSNPLAASPESGRTMARTGLRMMPTFPSSPPKIPYGGF